MNKVRNVKEKELYYHRACPINSLLDEGVKLHSSPPNPESRNFVGYVT